MGCQVVSLGFDSCCHNGRVFQMYNLCGTDDVCFKEGSAKGAFLVRFRFVSSSTRSLSERATLPSRPLRISRRDGPVGENAAAYRTLLSRNILLWGFGDTIGFLQEICSDVAS